jgi:hypothetical protein
MANHLRSPLKILIELLNHFFSEESERYPSFN